MKKTILLFAIIFSLRLASNAQWTPLNTGFSDYFTDVQFTDANTGFLFTNLKICKTTNAGQNWSVISIPSTASHFYVLNSNNIYLTTGSGSMYTSTDGGTNWLNHSTGYSSYFTTIFFVNQNVGFIAADYGKIFKTTDGGNNWSMSQLSNPIYPSRFCFTDASTGYIVGEGGGIFKTTNAGGSWFDITCSQNTNHLNGIHFKDANNGYAAGANGTILKTTNAGLNWSVLNSGTTNPLWGISSNGSKCIAVGISGAIVLSTDNGNSWVDNSVNSEHLMGMTFASSTTAYACGNNGTVLKYTGSSAINNLENNPFFINIFPNPISDETSVNYTLSNSNYVQISVYDTKGNKIATPVDYIQQKGDYSIKLAGTKFENGLYLVNIFIDNKTFNFKLIKK